jgi:transcriptional regulator with XRE-family HTH domain
VIETAELGFFYDKIRFVLTETGEETITRLLSGYEFGPKLRHLRLRKKIGLVDLGKHTGLSASMLSQLENGKLVPTLPTLARIAVVFDVGLDYFFADQRKRKAFSIVRAQERMKFPERAGVPDPAFYFECLNFHTQDSGMHAFLAEFPRRAKDEVDVHFHDGAEFIHVLEGSMSIRFHEEDHVLKAGDSVYFDASAPHGYRGISAKPTKALVVTHQPRL